jgi:FkbM family methyltransferase
MDIIVNKNNISFIVPPTGNFIQDWYKNKYATWEQDTFDIINRFVSKDKILFDIGSWVGPISICYSYLFSKVIAVEADKDSVYNLKQIIDKNNISNIEIIEKAIFSESNKTIFFGPSNFRNDLPGLNQSTSHVKYNKSKNEDYGIDTISLADITKPYLSNIGLIKIDIEGGEGEILDDVFNLINLGIPMLISFHLPWIQNKDTFNMFCSNVCNDNKIKCYDSDYNSITSRIYDYIIANNFGSILFIKN